MSQQELNLLKLSASGMAQPRACSTKIMRGQLLDAHSRGELLHDAPHDLFCDSTAPNRAGLGHTTEYFPYDDLCHPRPCVNRGFDPFWNWNRPDVTAFSNQVNYGLVIFSLLKMLQSEMDKFGSAQSATKQDC